MAIGTEKKTGKHQERGKGRRKKHAALHTNGLCAQGLKTEDRR